MYIMLNSISKTVACATSVVATARHRESVKLSFTMPSILMNIIYVMPKSTRAADLYDGLTE
jgi:hypothetical protein